jgi:hypothetical protein
VPASDCNRWNLACPNQVKTEPVPQTGGLREFRNGNELGHHLLRTGRCHHHRFAEVGLGVSRRMRQRHKHLALAQFPYPPSGGNLPQDNTFLRPVQPTETATLSLTGSFTAGGGIKPLYAIKEIGNFGAPERYRFYSWLPVFTSEVDINQSVSAGNEPTGYRTRVDPDSISVGGALWKVTPFKHGPFYDLTTHLQLFDFEFARTDPTSAYVGGFGTQAVTKPWQNQSGSVALTGDLYFGIEAGHNLDKPNVLDSVAVDLSHYNGIFRGVFGSDATFAVESADWTTVVFSLIGTYRVRIPTMDEPFVTDLHGNKEVGLSTKARNWVDITATYNPFHWKYFSFQAEYKYGEKPPVFSFVDHSVTVGINLSAIQPSLAKF